jgi:hypothetical protein
VGVIWVLLANVNLEVSVLPAAHGYKEEMPLLLGNDVPLCLLSCCDH